MLKENINLDKLINEGLSEEMKIGQKYERCKEVSHVETRLCQAENIKCAGSKIGIMSLARS